MEGGVRGKAFDGKLVWIIWVFAETNLPSFRLFFYRSIPLSLERTNDSKMSRYISFVSGFFGSHVTEKRPVSIEKRKFDKFLIFSSSVMRVEKLVLANFGKFLSFRIILGNVLIRSVSAKIDAGNVPRSFNIRTHIHR